MAVSTALMRAWGTLGIQQAFTSDHNPKGNADPERVIRTLKEECLWLHLTFRTLFRAAQAI